jgi:hypothetical protein
MRAGNFAEAFGCITFIVFRGRSSLFRLLNP